MLALDLLYQIAVAIHAYSFRPFWLNMGMSLFLKIPMKLNRDLVIPFLLYRTLLPRHFEMSTSEVGSSYTLWKERPVQKEHTMSDNLRRYRAIRDALTQQYPGQPTGTVARHLTTLAALISGIVGSKSTQLPSVATKIPDGTKPESRVKRLTRWLDNARILEEVYFLPYVDLLLAQLALETLVIVMDGSVVGRGCLALMLHVVYKGRALPLAWRVRHSPKGHCPEALHIAIVELMSELIPEGAKMVFLGDGEFDGTDLQDTLNEAGWSYVCRTALSTTATWDGKTFPVDTLGACLKPGRLIKLAPCGRTFLVHHVPGSLPTSPSNPQSCQRELSHELFPIPVRARVWRETAAGTITPT